MVMPTETWVRDVRIRPNVALAPMEGVTDLCFRRMIRGIGGVGLTCTEFVASRGLSPSKSRRLWEMAAFDPDERPVAVQIFGRDPETMANAARLIEDRGATLIDINMGCPSKKVCANSGGSALMADLDVAVSVVRAVRQAISVPLTVKMRSGFDRARRNAPELAWRCQEEGAEGVTIHWRTREDGYKGVRAVDKIAEAVQRVSIPVFANGDIIDVASARAMFAETGCAGVMVGRGAVANPWLLRQIAQSLRGEPVSEPTVEEKRTVLLAFFDDLIASFHKKTGALGRIKGTARRFVTSEAVRTKVLRAKSCEEARDHVAGWLTRPAFGDGGTGLESSSAAPPRESCSGPPPSARP